MVLKETLIKQLKPITEAAFTDYVLLIETELTKLEMLIMVIQLIWLFVLLLK